MFVAELCKLLMNVGILIRTENLCQVLLNEISIVEFTKGAYEFCVIRDMVDRG
ncbi:MAG: hypothetical protein KDB01_17710 [Planctomycetaceae bacterium]|nr:hypothetical protein [Planctomycetaceae bacterium]